MPLFEFDCESCGKTVEILVRGLEKPTCPDCEGSQLSKRLSVPAPVNAARNGALPLTGGCASNLPPCSPMCCRIPGR